jgi:H3 lysine-79-specific histone-lysine N-methyltransferase
MLLNLTDFFRTLFTFYYINTLAFSDATYGELRFALVEEMIQEAGINGNSIFVDLGCGIGNVVIHVNARVGCDSYGVELNEARHEIADRQINEYKGRMA